MSTSSADYNAQIIDEFRANNGHVGGMWEGTPGHPDRPDARRERLSGSTAPCGRYATGPWWRSHDEGGSE